MTDPAELPARWWRSLGWPIFIFVIAMPVMFAAGVPFWRALLLAIVIAVALWAMIISFTTRQPTWPYDVATGFYRVPTSWEVAGLDSAKSSPETFSDYLRPRLWADVSDVLVRRGVDPQSHEARLLVGQREYAILTAADTDERHIAAMIPRLCQVVAALATERQPGASAVVRRRALSGIAGVRSRQKRPPEPQRKEHDQ